MHSANVVSAWVIAAHDQLRATMDDVGLDARSLAALTLVREHDGCSVDWLRRRIELTQSGTVRLVDRLVARDLLRRGRPSGREVPLHVTRRGTAILARWARARERTVAELLAGLSPRQQQATIRAMATSLEAVPRVRAQADATCRTCSWPDCGTGCPVDRSVHDTGA
jgi:DNA-binding MarR family transcriptional regulator